MKYYLKLGQDITLGQKDTFFFTDQALTTFKSNLLSLPANSTLLLQRLQVGILRLLQ